MISDAVLNRTHNCGQLRQSDLDSEVRLCGWVRSYRDHGGVIFIDLRDRYGITQVVFDTPQDGDDAGKVKAMECIKMELGEPDDSGRRRPFPIEGSNYIMEVDLVVVAIGNSSNPLVQQTTPGLETNKWGNIVVNEATMRTSREGVYAGGDIVTGGATVILAAGAGKTAARAIHRYLLGEPEEEPQEVVEEKSEWHTASRSYHQHGG